MNIAAGIIGIITIVCFTSTIVILAAGIGDMNREDKRRKREFQARVEAIRADHVARWAEVVAERNAT